MCNEHLYHTLRAKGLRPTSFDPDVSIILVPAQDAPFALIIWYVVKTHLFIVGIVPIRNKELQFIFSIRSIWSYMRFKLGENTIRYIYDTHNLNILCIISYYDIFTFFRIITITTYMLLF